MELHQQVLFILISFYCFNSNVFSSQTVETQKKTICHKIVSNLSEFSSEFIRCAVQNSEPVNYCSHCNTEFLKTIERYHALTTTISDDPPMLCSEQYIDADRLNIIVNTQNYITSLWTLGSCDDCYDNCDLSKFPTNCTVSNNTKLFQNSSSHFKECYKAHIGNDTVCQNCGDAYNKMNTIYNDIRKGKGDKFCFDIKDKMNKTRILWSKELHCCDDRNPSKTAFYSMASTSVFLAILFYLGIYLHSKRQERLGFIENDLNHRITARAATSYGAMDNNETTAVPSTSTNNEYHAAYPISYKENIRAVKEESDDDQPLPLVSNSLTSDRDLLRL